MGRRGRGDGWPPGMIRLTHRESHQVTSNEDWYPTVDGLVTVYLHAWSNGAWRVAVWGGDDHGLEREFTNECQARGAYRRVGHCVMQADLWAQGFYQA